MGTTAGSPTQPPDSPMHREVKITLYIALGFTVISLLLFAKSWYDEKNKRKKDQYHKWGALPVVGKAPKKKSLIRS